MISQLDNTYIEKKMSNVISFIEERNTYGEDLTDFVNIIFLLSTLNDMAEEYIRQSFNIFITIKNKTLW